MEFFSKYVVKAGMRRDGSPVFKLYRVRFFFFRSLVITADNAKDVGHYIENVNNDDLRDVWKYT